MGNLNSLAGLFTTLLVFVIALFATCICIVATVDACGRVALRLIGAWFDARFAFILRVAREAKDTAIPYEKLQ